MNIETANILLSYRKKHNLSQEELAEKIGVSRQAVSKWERAEASPDTDNLILLSEIYGVSLDELLKGEKPNNENEAEAKEASQPETHHNVNGDDDVTYEKVDKVSFKNGIHIDAKNGDKVHIGFDGIHVHDKDGTKVDIDGKGVFVNEGGKQRVYTDENGNVMRDSSFEHHCCGEGTFWHKFPIYIVAIIAFLVWGFSGMYFGWALSWICFFIIPLYYSTVDAIYKRNPSHFAFPVLTAAIYILFGFFNICGGWALGWIIFLTIPIYYWICSFFKSKDE